MSDQQLTDFARRVACSNKPIGVTPFAIRPSHNPESVIAKHRHVHLTGRPHDRPIYDPPATLPEGIRRDIDVASLIAGVVVSPFAPADRLAAVHALLADAGIVSTVCESPLTPYASLIPTDDELRRFTKRS